MLQFFLFILEPMTALESLQKAFNDKNLTLYLGAGVSMDSGLPSWEGLVLAMYFKIMDQQRLGMWRPFPNYLLAISDWQIKNLQEPLEITARKIRLYYGGDQAGFLKSLRETLYQGFTPANEYDFVSPGAGDLMLGNPTLHAVADLCGHAQRGVDAVVTYNYDALLEKVLMEGTFEAICRTDHAPDADKIPVYHVHGYVPFQQSAGSSVEDIVFTEDQYNRVANDPYSWSNLVQIHRMSSSVGLMIGLSLSDRNMRRLFDAVRRSPIETSHFAILKRREWKVPSGEELSKINEQAILYAEKFARSGIKGGGGGMKKGLNWEYEIKGILKEVQLKSDEQETLVLNELGIEPIWVDEYEEIPDTVAQIMM